MAVIDTLITARAPSASPAFTGVPTAPTPAGGSNDQTVATTSFVKTAITAGAVASFNTRVGAVVSQAGDYTAAQVTNAADKSSGSTQVFSAGIQAPTHNVGSGVGSITFDSPGSGFGRLWSASVGTFVLDVGASGQAGVISTAGNSLTIGGSTSTVMGFFGSTGITRPGNFLRGLDVNGASGGAVFNNFTSGGSIGSTQYSFDDIVRALKNLGLITP